jgi:hypothetical protein
MATPAFLRYLPARLKPLSAPAVWAPLAIFTLVSAFLWESHRNPEWFNRPQANTANPESTLTAEEQAQLSEIDTLDVLLKGAKLPSTASTADEAQSPDKAKATAEDTANSRNLAGRDNPFAAYEEAYKFPGAASTANTPTLPTALSGSAPSSSSGSPAAAAPLGSALSEALNRQQASRDAAAPASQAAGQTAGQAAGPNSSASGASGGFAGGVPSLPTASSNGISAPYIRTTPEMSPPVGTTGYQPPASSNLPVFNVAPQQASRNPYSSGSSSFQQNFNQAQPGLPQLNSPQPNSPQPNVAAPSGSYTPPSFTQPEQNRRVR